MYTTCDAAYTAAHRVNTDTTINSALTGTEIPLCGEKHLVTKCLAQGHKHLDPMAGLEPYSWEFTSDINVSLETPGHLTEVLHSTP